MRTYTGYEVCTQIDALDKKRTYGYINPVTRGEIQIIEVRKPEGPIIIRRRGIGFSWSTVSISPQMIWRTANALNSQLPVNIDRVLAGSYNTRSVLEALLAYTPEIYTCTPGRQQMIGDTITIKTGHKHIIWQPDNLHQAGVLVHKDLGSNCIINEVPSIDTMYDVVPVLKTNGLDFNIQRRHSQIQVALAVIAKSMNMRSWIAVEDHGILFNGRIITEYPYIVKDLNNESVISNFPKIVAIGKHIDCMFFNGGLPFVFEVEHSTGVKSGLTRMLQFKNEAEYLNTHYVIVAPDAAREDVIKKISIEQYNDLSALYFPYSQVEELYSFFSRHSGKVLGIGKEFLLTFMEKAS